MDKFKIFNDIINNIEENLESNIEIDSLSRMSGMSLYEFRRIFSILTGVSIGEYIRKRRLSVAAEYLMTGKYNVTQLAGKYGYDSPSSFARAFKQFHGFAPTDIHSSEHKINMQIKISFDIRVDGGTKLQYFIIDEDGYTINGMVGYSDVNDSECCENVWDSFYKSSIPQKIEDTEATKIYAVYENNQNKVKCVIGGRNIRLDDEISYTVPASKWLCFRIKRTDDLYVNNIYKDIVFKWFSSSIYERTEELPNIEIFPADMSEDTFEWEIRIPIRLKER